MSNLLNNTLAAVAAVVISLTSLSAITTVPASQTVAIAAPVLA